MGDSIRLLARTSSRRHRSEEIWEAPTFSRSRLMSQGEANSSHGHQRRHSLADCSGSPLQRRHASSVHIGDALLDEARRVTHWLCRLHPASNSAGDRSTSALRARMARGTPQRRDLSSHCRSSNAAKRARGYCCLTQKTVAPALQRMWVCQR